MGELPKQTPSRRGIVAAGHSATARTAQTILEAGGTAFDAVVAAHFAACVAEPVLCSLGGGGFMIGQQADGPTRIFDFFAHTPQRKRPAGEVDFRPILADFGDAQQEFHIGLGSIATPGTVRGLFAIHRKLGTLPMRDLLAPAIALARDGVVINAMQAYAFSIVERIYTATPDALAVFASPSAAGRLVAEGEWLRQPALADVLERLAVEGEAWFYEGEFAHMVAELSARQGGSLSLADFRDYRVREHEPLAIDYRGNRVWTNPPPSSGGLLIAFGLKLLEAVDVNQLRFGSREHLALLSQVMDLTYKARVDAHLDDSDHPDAMRLLEPGLLKRYQQEVMGRAAAVRGTTHLNVMDAAGNVAAMTMSNGEGCGYIVPDTGIMLNNMLGEEDLNPGGFHRWAEDQRMTSMMSPTLVVRDNGDHIALGSGGSNRIRTAILQVLVNILDIGMPLSAAVEAPRIHMENGLLSVEQGFERQSVTALIADYPRHQLWDKRSLFFGGVHVVQRSAAGFTGAGDPRRGGVVVGPA